MLLNYYELEETRQKEENSPRNALLDFLLQQTEPLWHCVHLFTVFSTSQASLMPHSFLIIST